MMSATNQMPVIDDRQLRLIEASHRGMLYQHLYGVGCLFLASEAGVLTVNVERDEDIEIQFADKRVYIQVKTRSELLTPSTIEDVLHRASTIRVLHAGGQRAGKCEFLIVSDQPPGPKLAQQLASNSWPQDVRVAYPGVPESLPTWAPPAWPSLRAAIEWNIGRAQKVPLRIISAETLVWKLAALIQLAAAGARPEKGHQVDAGELPKLFEQFVVQLQSFPASPRPYRLQEKEPDIVSAERVRIIVGFSGAGKTAWASQAATHASANTV